MIVPRPAAGVGATDSLRILEQLFPDRVNFFYKASVSRWGKGWTLSDPIVNHPDSPSEFQDSFSQLSGVLPVGR